MARQVSFGDRLREGRERKGLDLSTVARKLRIRPDILRAIEDGDFARMPPRGYTSNMVAAYARLVGLNPAELTRDYRDEAHQFETGRRPMGPRSDRQRGGSPAERRGSSSRGSRRGDFDDGPSRSSRPSRSSERRRRGAVPVQPQYTNLVQGRQAPGITANFGSMLPLLVVGALVVVLLILVLFLAFGGNRATSAEDVPPIPVSGMPNPAGTSTGATDASGQAADAPAVQPVAPTSAKFTYKVADGKKVYIEVIVDGKTKEADDVTGPKEMSYDVTGTLKFVVSGDPSDVEIAVDGEKAEPTESKSGVYTYTVDFDQVLEAWREKNAVGGSSSGDSSDGDGKDASSGTGDGGTSGGSDDEAGTSSGN